VQPANSQQLTANGYRSVYPGIRRDAYTETYGLQPLILAIADRRGGWECNLLRDLSYLPARGQHQLYRIDWGLAVDFWICVICYFLVRLIP
jgi:hypothetical protein